MARRINPEQYRTGLTTQQFADRMRSLGDGVRHGDNPADAVVRVRDGWRLLDPINTARGAEALADSTRLSVALGHAALVAGEVKKKATKWAGNLKIDLLLDKAAAHLRTPTDRPAAVDALGAVIDSASNTDPKKTESAFNNLSARAMLLHLESQRLDERSPESWQRRGAEALVQASLGVLIKDSVGVLRHLHSGYKDAVTRGGDGTHLTGRMVETMCFTHHLMRGYREDGSLKNAYPRFALYREDKPLITPVPRRSFDVAVLDRDPTVDPKLLQVKTGQSSAAYADGITVWKPNRQGGTGIIDETEQIMGWFDALIDNEVSETDMAAAWRNLNARFEEPK